MIISLNLQKRGFWSLARFNFSFVIQENILKFRRGPSSSFQWQRCYPDASYFWSLLDNTLAAPMAWVSLVSFIWIIGRPNTLRRSTHFLLTAYEICHVSQLICVLEPICERRWMSIRGCKRTKCVFVWRWLGWQRRGNTQTTVVAWRPYLTVCPCCLGQGTNHSHWGECAHSDAFRRLSYECLCGSAPLLWY